MNRQTATRQSDKAVALLRSRGMVRLREFIDEGIAEETIARLARQGQILRLARGLYQLPDADLAAQHTLAEASKLVPKGVICLISALQFHGLTVQMPSAVWLAIDPHTRRPHVKAPRLRFVRFGGSALTEGIETHDIEGVAVRIFDVPKTVVDCFRYRNKIGLDVALEGMREALKNRRCRPDDIRHYALELRAWSSLRPYLEATLADGT